MTKYNIGHSVKVNDTASLWEMDESIGLEGKVKGIDMRNGRPGGVWYIVEFDDKPAAHFPEMALDLL